MRSSQFVSKLWQPQPGEAVLRVMHGEDRHEVARNYLLWPDGAL